MNKLRRYILIDRILRAVVSLVLGLVGLFAIFKVGELDTWPGFFGLAFGVTLLLFAGGILYGGPR